MLGTAFLLALLLGELSYGQFFPVQLPRDDFLWTWGRVREVADRRSEDFNMNGSEGGFRCQLRGKFGIAAGFSPSQERDIENQLRTSGYFIQATANIMNQLDYNRDIEWAILDCDRYEDEASEDELAEREDRAREKAERRRERRRAQD